VVNNLHLCFIPFRIEFQEIVYLLFGFGEVFLLETETFVPWSHSSPSRTVVVPVSTRVTLFEEDFWNRSEDDWSLKNLGKFTQSVINEKSQKTCNSQNTNVSEQAASMSQWSEYKLRLSIKRLDHFDQGDGIIEKNGGIIVLLETIRWMRILFAPYQCKRLQLEDQNLVVQGEDLVGKNKRWKLVERARQQFHKLSG
jgi:hypothetical protein